MNKVNEQLDLDKEAILEIRVEGALQVKKKVPNYVMIFLVPPTKEDLYKRLRYRGTESEEIIEQKAQKAKENLKRINSKII